MSRDKERSNIGVEFIGLCYENNVKKEALEAVFQEAVQTN